MIETHQAHHSSSYSRTFIYCQVNSNLPAVSPSCSNTAADASLSCSVAGQGTVVWWNTCLWKQNKANICLLPCAEHSNARNRVKKNLNAEQLCHDAPSSSHLDNWSFDIIKRMRMSHNSLLLKNLFIGLLLPWLVFYLHAFLGPVIMIMKDTLWEGLCIICSGRWSMACFNLPSWLHSAEKRYLIASRWLQCGYTLGMSVTNTLVRLSIRRCRVTQAGHLCRMRSESFAVTSATFPVIQRASLSTGKVWLLHTISLIAFSPSPLHYVDNLWRYILCRGHSEVAITHCDRDNQSQQVSSRRGWRRPLVGCPQHAC